MSLSVNPLTTARFLNVLSMGFLTYYRGLLMRYYFMIMNSLNKESLKNMNI